MQPEDQSSSRRPNPPDLPDGALPEIESVEEAGAPVAGMPKQSNQTEAKSKPHHQGRHHLSGIGKKYFKYIEFDDEEELLAEIRKHPFGLLIVVFIGVFVSLAVFVGLTILASTDFLESIGLGGFNSAVVFAGFLMALFVLVITAVNAYLYRNNVVFVTNEKIAQVLFITLFNRKLSQLSIGDVQDVTVQQNGFIPNLVGYGTLVIETAGEQQNYTFTFVPKPYETSKVIINAHESNLKKYGN